MSYPGYLDDMYNDLMKNYHRYGEELEYGNSKIYHMSNATIKQKLHFHIYPTTPFFNPQDKGWADVFNDVLYNRRFKKLNKIIKNIK